MLADISLPDFETRLAILRLKASERNFEINDDILTFIATNIQKNIRELEGALNKIIAHFELTKTQPNFENVKNILSSLTQQSKNSPY